MIVDVHTHVWDRLEQLGPATAERVRRAAPAPWEQPEATVNALDEAMRPITHVLIHGFESGAMEAAVSIEQVARFVRRRPGKYLGVAGVDPLAGGYADRLAEAAARKLVGVTVCPAGAGFHPCHSQAMRLYDWCQAKGMPLFVDMGVRLSAAARMEFAQPHLFDEVARSFPRLRIVIAQVGYPWTDPTLTLIGKHENVFADLTDIEQRPWQLYNVLLSANQLGVIDHLLFGSDFPFNTPEKAISTIYSVNTFSQGGTLPSVPREKLRSIVERDTLALLGIARPVTSARDAAEAQAAEALAMQREAGEGNGADGDDSESSQAIKQRIG